MLTREICSRYFFIKAVRKLTFLPLRLFASQKSPCRLTADRNRDALTRFSAACSGFRTGLLKLKEAVQR